MERTSGRTTTRGWRPGQWTVTECVLSSCWTAQLKEGEAGEGSHTALRLYVVVQCRCVVWYALAAASVKDREL